MAVMLVKDEPVGMLQLERHVNDFVSRIEGSSESTAESAAFFRQLIAMTLQIDPSHRPSASEVIGYLKAGKCDAPVQASQSPGGSSTDGGTVNSTTASPLTFGSLTATDRMWKKDTSSATCCVCTTKFGFLRRKHHCRYAPFLFSLFSRALSLSLSAVLS